LPALRAPLHTGLMRSSLAITSLLLGSCASPGETPGRQEATIGEEFTLAPGEVAHLGGTLYLITFNNLVEDSRCPPEVTCVWEGNARLALTVREVVPGKEKGTIYEVVDTEIELNTSTRFPTRQPFAFWSIELRKLEPAAPFRATLLVVERS
jgi:hypothetical protein